jgi:hypothetical protein
MGGYRGRRTVTDVLRVIVAILLVIVVLLFAGLWFAQRYIVYTDDGIQLVLPFFQWSLGGNGSRDPSSDISFVERPTEQDTEGDTSQTQPQQEDGTVTKALQLPVSALSDGTLQQRLEEAGANSLVLEMKNQEGQLAWVSLQALADYAHVNGENEQRDEALRQWNAGEVHTVALVRCFRDNTLPYFRNSLAMHSSYGNWRDELKLRWLDPTSDEVREYLAGLCGELGQLGFDEILLEDCMFPVQGNTEFITTQFPEDRAASLEAFLAQVKQAVEPYGTEVSVLADADAEAGGLTLDLLNRCADRVWTADVAPYAALGEDRVVVLQEALTGAESGSKLGQAVLLN